MYFVVCAACLCVRESEREREGGREEGREGGRERESESERENDVMCAYTYSTHRTSTNFSKLKHVDIIRYQYQMRAKRH